MTYQLSLLTGSPRHTSPTRYRSSCRSLRNEYAVSAAQQDVSVMRRSPLPQPSAYTRSQQLNPRSGSATKCDMSCCAWVNMPVLTSLTKVAIGGSTQWCGRRTLNSSGSARAGGLAAVGRARVGPGLCSFRHPVRCPPEFSCALRCRGLTTL